LINNFSLPCVYKLQLFAFSSFSFLYYFLCVYVHKKKGRLSVSKLSITNLRVQEKEHTQKTEKLPFFRKLTNKIVKKYFLPILNPLKITSVIFLVIQSEKEKKAKYSNTFKPKKFLLSRSEMSLSGSNWVVF
jgi:hypothetical protein